MNTTEKMEQISIEKLVPYINNSRTHSPEQLKKLQSSLREFGFVNPVLIDSNFNILSGHGRILAAKAEGLTEVPCVFVEHLTDAQKKAYIIADNRLAEDAGWDNELLKLEIENLKELEFDINELGFEVDELDRLLNLGADVTEDNFDEPLPETPITKQGDIWLLGRHRLICGDSTKLETYTTIMGGKKANLVVTDPPYNVAYEGTAGTIQNDNMDDKKFYEFLLSSYKGMYESLADGGSIYVFHADRETVNFRMAFKDAGFFCHQTCIWVKNSPVLGRCDYQYTHEPVLVGWKPTAGHKFYADRKQRTTWNFDRPTKSKYHPTMKPIALVAYPITNSSLTNSIVLDPFGGSGSTLIACEQTDRICYTAEIDEKYCDVITKRWIEQVGSDNEVFLIRNNHTIPFVDVDKCAE